MCSISTYLWKKRKKKEKKKREIPQLMQEIFNPWCAWMILFLSTFCFTRGIQKIRWQFKIVQSMESATMETSNFKKMQSCGWCSNYKKRPWTCMVYGIDQSWLLTPTIWMQIIWSIILMDSYNTKMQTFAILYIHKSVRLIHVKN